MPGPRPETVGAPTLLEVRGEECFLLLADLCGFSKLAQTMPPRELTSLVGKWMAACKTVLERHGAAIDKYLGDGFLAYWPGRASSPERVSAALKELQTLPAQAPGGFRLAVHFGEVVFGAAPTRSESILPGNEVNYVFRMEKLAAQNEVTLCLSEPARAKMDGHLSMEPIPGDHSLKGFAGEHRFFRVA
jgi:adenylate cyclase